MKIFKGKLVLSFHGTDLVAAKQSRGLNKFFWKALLLSADNIITCSEYLKEIFVNFDEVSKSKSFTVHNGTDASKFSGNYSNYFEALSVSTKYILNVGTLDYIKGQDVLLKAFGEISQEFEDVCLVIIGRPGGAEDKVKQLIGSLNLSQKVHLYEGLSNDKVLAFMERASVFVLPSRHEAFGIVILEAGAFGVPVIASNVGGIREILSHDKTGRLCDPDDAKALAFELKNLLDKPEERNRLGENLRKHVIENFSWNRTYKKYLDCLGL